MIAFAAVLVCYLIIPSTELPSNVGRYNPSLASLLSPPDFNFQATYDQGEVLGLRVGMSRAEFVEQLTRLFPEDTLAGNCAEVRELPNQIPVTGNKVFLKQGVVVQVPNAEVMRSIALAAETICVFGRDRPRVVAVVFAEEHIATIEVTYARFSI
jgi:hypothetical protein